MWKGIRYIITLVICLQLIIPGNLWSQSRSIRLDTIEIPPWHRRIALVIGNSAYKSKSLKNTLNDASDMENILRQLGFRVFSLLNGDRNSMRKIIREFGEALKEEKGVGLFFYAGHGLQVQGVNYLIPTGVNITAEYEIEDEGIKTDFILKKMIAADSWLNIVLLDACRDNPFQSDFHSSRMGLVEMKAPPGTLIGYSTAPGSVADDGKGRNGVYTKYLLKYLLAADTELLQAMKMVARGVQKETARNQIPWKADNLTVDFYMNTTQDGGKSGEIKSVTLDQVETDLSLLKKPWPWWVWGLGGAVLVGFGLNMNNSSKDTDDKNESGCTTDQCGSVEVTW